MRLELTTRSDLAIQAINFLGDVRRRSPSTRVRRTILAEELNTTPDFLARVMGPLVKKGWVSSVTGPGGGYRLERHGYTATVFELIDTVEGVPQEGQCVLRQGACDAAHKCALHDAWTRARKAMISELKAEKVLSKGMDHEVKT